MIHAREDYNRIQDPANKIGENEPVFLVRANDQLAPGVLMAYASELTRRGGCKKIARMVVKHAVKMVEWQEKNGCKLPDL